jgi:hypothetical protein
LLPIRFAEVCQHEHPNEAASSESEKPSWPPLLAQRHH